MATKNAVKKATKKRAAAPATKRVAAKKTKPAKSVSLAEHLDKGNPKQTNLPLTKPVAAQVPPKRGRGRPAGSGNKSAGKPGVKAATEFWYSLRPISQVDEDGLDIEPSEPYAVTSVGPFNSEEEATTDALAKLGTQTDMEVVLLRDYKRGRPEVRTRLV